MRIEDAAERAGVSPRTIWRWISEGRLRTTRVTESFSFNSMLFYERHDISLEDLIEADDQRNARSLGTAAGHRNRRERQMA